MNHKAGYTLMELIVVAGIIAVMSSVFVGAELPKKRLALQREAYFLTQNLRKIETASSAIQGAKVCKVETGENPEEGFSPKGGYAIFFEKDKDNYIIFANCSSIKTRQADGSYIFNDHIKLNCQNCRAQASVCSQESCQTGEEPFATTFLSGDCGKKCVDETMEEIDFSSRASGTKISKLEAQKANSESFMECQNLIIGYEPPDPLPYIFCNYEGVGADAIASPFQTARIYLKMEGGGERMIEVNAAGMISTKIGQ